MNDTYLAPLIYERDRWQAMADQAHSPVWITDATGEVTGFNRAWLTWRGRSLEAELNGGWRDGLHPDDLHFFTDSVRDHLPDRTSMRVQIRLRESTGLFTPVVVTGDPWHEADGTFGGFAFAAVPVAADQQPWHPTSTNDLYEATIEALQEGVVVTDEDGRLLAINEAASILLGLDRERVLGQLQADAVAHIEVIDEGGHPVPATLLPTAVARRTRRPVSGALLAWHVGDMGLRWFTVNSRPLLTEESAVTAVVTSFLDVTAQKHAADNARHEARHDALTGLVNRWGLLDVVRKVVERAPRTGEDVALAYCDVDNFKGVNDSLGHAAGDELLRTVAGRIKATVRSSDIVARVGGDEVVVVMDDVDGLSSALTVAEKIRANVARPISLRGQEITPHLSVGVAMLPSIDDFDEALNRADEAMYAAKAAGRNRVMTFDR